MINMFNSTYFSGCASAVPTCQTMQVCVVHPRAELQSAKKASMYASGINPETEEYRQYARFGYTAAAPRKYGMNMKGQMMLGQVWQPWYKTMLEQAGLRGKRHFVWPVPALVLLRCWLLFWRLFS